jgi:general stress protein 26
MSENLMKLAEVIRNIKYTMFTTVGEEGSLISRPMATQKIDETKFDGKLWFFTDINSPKVFNIAKDQHVNLAYIASGDQKYVSVSGRARIVMDKEKMKELWTPFMKAWFPEGIDDPNISLLCVDVDTAELWDSPTSQVVQLAGMAKALGARKHYNGGQRQHHLDVKGHH